MKLDFRRRLLATTLLVGTGVLATPAFAQDAQNPPPNPPDTSAVPTTPVTVAPQAAAGVPSTNASGAPTTSTQEIVVTGSRIPQPNLETASPVTTVSSQEVKLSGTTRTEDLVNSLPQVFASQGSNVSNGASGTATIDLRGLGSKRNLVLVNGRRLQAGDTGNPVADINFVPSQLIKRVDVLTGGASSVYGADAVAGVVNFIMDTTFTGFRIDGQASVFQHDNNTDGDILKANAARGFRPPSGNVVNGGAQDIAAMFGSAFDDGRGHVVAYATYRSQDPVLESTRDYSFCTLAAQTPANITKLGRKWGCGGSGTSANGTFLTNVGTFQVQGNQFAPGSTPFNFAPYNYFQRPDERYNFGAFADYEIAPGAHPYLEAMFMDDHTDAQIAPSGDFGNTATINCDNPFLSAQQRATICVTPVYDPTDANPTLNSKGQPVYKSNFGNLVGANPIFDPNGPKICTDPADPNTCRPIGIIGFTPATEFADGPGGGTFEQAHSYILRRNVEGGGRDDDVRHTDFRVVAGMRGEPIPGISYDAYYQTGHTLRQETYLNDFSVTRLNFALDAVAVDANGNIVAPGTPGSTVVCRGVATGVQAATGCVPYNVFTAGGVSPGALNYLQTPGFQRGSINENIAHLDVTFVGDEFGLKTPWSDTGIGANFGVEYRKEALDFKVDQEFQLGDLAGQGGPTPPVSGHFDSRDAFAEIQIPIIEHSFVDELSIDGGYRYSNYHVGASTFSTDTYKLEARFAPIKDIRFRASYNRAVRAPNIVELFAPQGLGLSGTVDPCANQQNGLGGPGTPTATAAACALTGVSAAQYGNILQNPANQMQGLFGGNPDLKPETADTWTAGVILQPRFIPGLALTGDYFNIHVKNIIGTLGWDAVMNGCLGGDTFLCGFIHRAPQSGSLWLGPNGFITLTTINQPGLGLRTRGIDFNGTYARHLGSIGTLNVSFVGTYLMNLQNPSQDIECAGFFGGACGSLPDGGVPNPKWRHVMRVGLTMPNGIGASIRWRHFSGVDAKQFAGPAEESFNQQNYFDLSFTARMQQRLNLRLGVNNIFDREPPIGGGNIPAGFGNGNTFPQVYDALGRYFFAGFTVDF